MKVEIVKLGHHPLYEALVNHLATRSPRITGPDLLLYDCKGGTIRGADLGDVEAFIYLPPYYMFSDPTQHTCTYPVGLVHTLVDTIIKAARQRSAKLVMVSEAQAAVLHTFKLMPAYDTEYGKALGRAENMVREYDKGIVIRVPMLDTDPWVLSLDVLGREHPLMNKEPDILFSLAKADDVAHVIGDAIESGWYGLHQLGGVSQNLRLSALVGHKNNLSSTLDYFLPLQGLVPPLPHPAQRVWDDLQGASPTKAVV